MYGNTVNATAWTGIGSQDLAQNTYASVKKAISNHPSLTDKDVEVFLQGSYANATNVRGDSDVDIVVMSNKTYYFNADRLSLSEKVAFDNNRVPASYIANQLRKDVLEAMRTYYGAARVEEHNKCIRVLKRDGYVDADVVPAFQYRLYKRYGIYGSDYIEGTAIFTADNDMIINYPKEHKKNGTTKNFMTSNQFKPTVRQLKNLKRHAVAQGALDPKTLPGYLLECLAYNAPNPLFGSFDHNRLTAVLNWLRNAEFGNLLSVDGIHTIFGSDPGNFSPILTRNSLHALAVHL